MSDEKNDDTGTGLEDLGLTDAAQPAHATEPQPAEPGPSQPTTPLPTASLPEAEPAWLSHWNARHGVERTAPRVRWAGVVWGLVFLATGWFAVWTMLAADRRAAFSDWILTLDGGGWAVAAAFAFGGLLLVVGLIEGLRAATRGR